MVNSNGEFDETEDMLAAAKRETQEETGLVIDAPKERFHKLSPVKQKSGKVVYSWAIEWDVTLHEFKSNLFEMEWPPHSGKKQSFVEVDKAAWFPIAAAKKKIIPGQIAIIEELQLILNKNNSGLSADKR